MTTKLSNQPAMVTVWNLGTVRNYIKMTKMQNPDQTGMFDDAQLAMMAEPTLQLSTNHAGEFFGLFLNFKGLCRISLQLGI